jgi:hypothetical protein
VKPPFHPGSMYVRSLMPGRPPGAALLGEGTSMRHLEEHPGHDADLHRPRVRRLELRALALSPAGTALRQGGRTLRPAARHIALGQARKILDGRRQDLLAMAPGPNAVRRKPLEKRRFLEETHLGNDQMGHDQKVMTLYLRALRHFLFAHGGGSQQMTHSVTAEPRCSDQSALLLPAVTRRKNKRSQRQDEKTQDQKEMMLGTKSKRILLAAKQHGIDQNPLCLRSEVLGSDQSARGTK